MAIKFNPNSVQAHTNIGVIYHLMYEFQGKVLTVVANFVIMEELTELIRDSLSLLCSGDDGIENKGILEISFLDLFEKSSELGNMLLSSPSKVLPAFEKELNALLRIKADPFVQVRIHSLPNCSDLIKKQFPGTKDAGRFITVIGTVVRVYLSKLLEYAKIYQCTVCDKRVKITAQRSKFHAFPKSGGACPDGCPKGTLKPMAKEEGSSFFKDYQEVRIQEQVDNGKFSAAPRVLAVILLDDLVNRCNPGDDVEIWFVQMGYQSFTLTSPAIGHTYYRTKPREGDRLVPEEVFSANHITITNAQRAQSQITNEMVSLFEQHWNSFRSNPLEGRNLIVSSFCTKMFGLYNAKLAACVVLAGGVPRNEKGTKIRGNSHILLLGDPGTGKSEILKFATLMSPRSILTTGVGTTTAGLTASAVKDGEEWTLEPGALPLCDGGVCSIDEFSTMKSHDLTSIHEAMEQEEISIAKGAMVTTLPTRVTIFAASNPLEKYDYSKTLTANTGLTSPLLSRFDVVLLILDVPEVDWDSAIADFVLKGKCDGKASNSWAPELLAAYFSYIKEFKPVMTKDAIEVISAYYHRRRADICRDECRTTIRLLESMIRLSEGHAKLMFRTTVEVTDAIVAIAITESSLQNSIFSSNRVNNMHTGFPKSSRAEYIAQAEIILGALNLQRILETELNRLDSEEPSNDNTSTGETETAPIVQGRKFRRGQRRIVTSSNDDTP